jgi:hypothetical protein
MLPLLSWGKAVFACSVLLCQPLFSAPEGQRTKTTTIRPLVVMKQSEICGRVFFIQEETEKGKPATVVRPGVKIELRTADQDIVLHKTATDESGCFTLPNLDVGAYRLVVARLTMNLRVEDPPTASEGIKQMSKTIVVFIPGEIRE